MNSTRCHVPRQSSPSATGIDSRAARFLDALRTRAVTPAERVAVVVAHADDETIGVGAQLPRLPGLVIVHVTDGAPRNMADATRHGFETPEAYAAARRQELEAAMALAGVPGEALISLGFADQEASRHLAEISKRLVALFAERRIEVVLTHPYEGGHPDHDATAFSVHAASALLARDGREPPAIVEMASYHAGTAGLAPQRFVPEPDAPEILIPLNAGERALKRRMIAAHATQAEVLSAFSADAERFRPAPRYDFSALPNGGQLYYAGFDWGMTGERWLGLASRALEALGLEPRL
jgi:LmbE family N-acetylglucosaminyl deacetylase